MWWIILSLILLGVILMLIELLLIPGVGVAGILSLASMGAACWYAFSFCSTVAGIVTTCISVALLIAMLIIVLREKTWKKFELGTEIKSKVNAESESLKVGDRGRTVTRLAPMGTALFADLSVEVKSSDNSMVSPGTTVEVVRIEDNKVIVKQVNE
ncbi:MAG: NfeD family protein [Bacteroidales bacterium]|nr:NfeD family protein [Bacteroidales bacterium]